MNVKCLETKFGYLKIVIRSFSINGFSWCLPYFDFKQLKMNSEKGQYKNRLSVTKSNYSLGYTDTYNHWVIIIYIVLYLMLFLMWNFMSNEMWTYHICSNRFELKEEKKTSTIHFDFYMRFMTQTTKLSKMRGILER